MFVQSCISFVEQLLHFLFNQSALETCYVGFHFILHHEKTNKYFASIESPGVKETK